MPVWSSSLKRPVAAHLLERESPGEERVRGLAVLANRVDDVGLVDVRIVARDRTSPRSPR